ncbi:hypothetical protein KV134_01635 [Tetragenococcus halophilus]|nr:hypothetical protein KV134_01635 [Tetragenococcus halophilus]
MEKEEKEEAAVSESREEEQKKEEAAASESREEEKQKEEEAKEAEENNEQSEQQEQQEETQPAEDPSGDQYVDENGNGLIKGSKSKIYHVPGSQYYDQTTNPERTFKSIEEAEDAGYRAPK